MEQDLSIIFQVPSVNHASGLLPFMCDISLCCLEGTQASTSCTLENNLLAYPPLKRVELPDLSISGLTISNKTALGCVPTAVT